MASVLEKAGESVRTSLNYVVNTGERIVIRPSVAGGAPGEREGRFEERIVEIRDARPLIGTLSLDREGFDLVRHVTAVTDFHDEDQLRTVYNPEIEKLVAAATGAARAVVFDHTRRSDSEETRKRMKIREPVQGVHNDYTPQSAPQRVRDLFPADEAEALLRRRFAIVNVWRSTGGPVETMPLCICDARSIAPGDLVVSERRAVDRIGYTFRSTIRTNRSRGSRRTPPLPFPARRPTRRPAKASSRASLSSSEPSTSASRGPRFSGPLLLRGGFRVFFPAAGLFAALAAPLWLALLAAGWSIPSPLAPPAWHGHEMLFGYVAAVIAGFLLTAIPNWTGRLPVAGGPLAALALLWLAGRAAMFAGASWPVAAAAVDAAFLVVLAGLAWREVIAGANKRNAPVCLLISIIALGNAGWHWAVLTGGDGTPFERAALAAVALLIMLIGGRVTPSFTRNWMVKAGHERLPAPFGAFDKAALGAALAALLVWVPLPGGKVTGALFALAAALHAVRLACWRGWATTAEPLVLILHLGYAWLPIWLGLAAAGMLAGAPDASSALHALTAGAAGTMTLAVMSRAMLGHTGRALTAGRATVAAYALVIAGAALRVAAPALPVDYVSAVVVAGLCWSAGFALYFAVYGPMGWGRGQGANG